MRRVEFPLGEVDPRSTLRTLAFMPGDPTVRLTATSFARATATPHGPGLISVQWSPGSAVVRTEGDGASWLMERAPRLLGLDDDPSGFEPTAPRLAQVWRRQRGDRLPRTGTLWHDLAWIVVQQRVNGLDAAGHWRRWVTSRGAPVADGLFVPPGAAEVANTPYEEFHRFGIERHRADALRIAARIAQRLENLVDGDATAPLAALRAERGIGPWTTSWIAAQTWGDADSVIVGDYGIPSAVAWLLAGEERADDKRMLDLLAEYAPHRHRIIRLTYGVGGPPRRAPRRGEHDFRRR